MNTVFQKDPSLQLVNQFGEFLKILPLLKIQLKHQMTSLCLPFRSFQMNHSLQKCFKRGRKTSNRQGKETFWQEKNKSDFSNLISGNSCSYHRDILCTNFYVTYQCCASCVPSLEFVCPEGCKVLREEGKMVILVFQIAVCDMRMVLTSTEGQHNAPCLGLQILLKEQGAAHGFALHSSCWSSEGMDVFCKNYMGCVLLIVEKLCWISAVNQWRTGLI